MKQNQYREESGLQRLRRNLEGLTFEQKIDHIFRYYWGTLLLVILIPVALGLILSSLLKEKPDLVFSGNVCNVTLTDDGASYLINDWSQLLDMEPGSLQLKLNYSDTQGSAALDVDGGMQVLASVAANSLDYLVCDPVAVEFFSIHHALLPLDEILDEATLSQWSDCIYTYTDSETGTAYPVALDVTELPFFRNSIQEDSRVYFAFANNDHADPQLLNLFLSHLTAWSSQ